MEKAAEPIPLGESEEGYMPISRERLVSQFSRLVSIDSPSREERAMGDYLKEQLTGLGIPVLEDDAGGRIGGTCGNLYAFLEGDGALEPLLFSVHMDTVEPSRGKRAVIGTDGIIRSGGDTVLGADDCAGIAAILEAVRSLVEDGAPHRPVELLFSAAEEIYSGGAAVFDCSRLRSREAYVLDLTGPVGEAAYRAPSILPLEVTVRGRAAHAGFAPEDGVHAIAAAADAVSKLTMGRLDEDTTFNIGLIQGGTATNIVPDLCVLRGEVRSYSHERALEAAEAVRVQFERSAAVFGAAAECSVRVGCRAYETAKEHPVVRRFEAACRRLNLPFALRSTFGGSDNNLWAERGIAGIVLACAMNRCHSCEEYSTVEELERIAALVRLLMTDGAR